MTPAVELSNRRRGSPGANPAVVFHHPKIRHLRALVKNQREAKVLTYSDFVHYACFFTTVIDSIRQLVIRNSFWHFITHMFLCAFEDNTGRAYSDAYPPIYPRATFESGAFVEMFDIARRIFPLHMPRICYGPSFRIPTRRFPAKIGGPVIDGLRAITYNGFAELSCRDEIGKQELLEFLFLILEWAGKSAAKGLPRNDKDLYFSRQDGDRVGSRKKRGGNSDESTTDSDLPPRSGTPYPRPSAPSPPSPPIERSPEVESTSTSSSIPTSSLSPIPTTGRLTPATFARRSTLPASAAGELFPPPTLSLLRPLPSISSESSSTRLPSNPSPPPPRLSR